ncbi:tRNA uracil 4-sulfurtransferase ThiI [Paenibacillus sp. YN15]|uniref:tRNA uracil 4-sulfurtransferase ThiI n=1 Tax=Paenibacillus sp. YN15 TaxID=1742774 RepID=UPI000DCCE09F|nr:tRNA uracil 4-sulfurtransferase ThiI [Paenibacillus sp. YN15]RAU99217.1 tRNA 4-thiouridine(8) synthase ThiI [Paenibacillus sp. YN15]
MNPNTVIVRLGELTLKGRNRHRFEKRVLGQLQPLQQQYPQVGISLEFGRIHIDLQDAPYEAAAEALDKIFGLASYSPAHKTGLELDQIRGKALELMRELEPSEGKRTFKVAAKRSNKKYPYDSMELMQLVGGHILRHTQGWAVDVHQPEVTLWVDVRDKEAFVFTDIVRGSGGYPLGTNGKALLLLSGGIDSPVAGWLSMRMGLELEAVHFHSYPYTSERAKRKVEELARELARYSGTLKLHMVPFTDIQVRLKEQGRENLLVICMKRAMLRIAEQLAERRSAKALITGESLGQVASQTLASLDVIGRAAEIPVLRPLITMDKGEIVKVSEKIGTFPISIQPYEDCCTLFLPKSPSTNPGLRTVEKVEAGIQGLDELIRLAVENTETQVIGAGQSSRKLDDLF